MGLLVILHLACIVVAKQSCVEQTTEKVAEDKETKA